MKLPVCCSTIILLSSVVVAQDIPPTTSRHLGYQTGIANLHDFLLGRRRSQTAYRNRIEYTADSFGWTDTVIQHPVLEVASISAEEFRDRNSGEGAKSSQVSFDQLGIRAAKVTQVTVKHPPAEITGATPEIPGDRVLLKNRSTIIFPVCNTYFEARRASHPNHHSLLKDKPR